MADELVVIGRGRMIYHGDVDGFVRRFTDSTVLVRSPHADRLATLLPGSVEQLADGALRVSGTDAGTIGELAYRNDIMLTELATQTASLESAFITATEADEEYVGGAA
jgi:ABC-2 type transport system ATP-binding protein